MNRRSYRRGPAVVLLGSLVLAGAIAGAAAMPRIVHAAKVQAPASTAGGGSAAVPARQPGRDPLPSGGRSRGGAGVGLSPRGGSAGASRGEAGWPGPKATYLGRYRLIASSDHALATSGDLTIFTRIPKGQKVPALSGILALHAPTQTNVLYLTRFATVHGTMVTSVNLGIYTGPVVARLVVHSFHDGKLSVRIVGSLINLSLSFQRYSRNPHP